MSKTVNNTGCSKAVNANPGLKVDQSINFCCLKMFLTSYLLCSLQTQQLLIKFSHIYHMRVHVIGLVFFFSFGLKVIF